MPAGTGKTIFAIEAAYRSLRAGSRVLMVFRSRQFYQILGNLLEEVSENLSLLLHLDFMYLLRQIELYGADSPEFLRIASELIPKAKENEGRSFFDLVVVDDCGTYETQMPYLIQWIEKLAYKKIYLVAPEQILDHLMPDDENDSEASKGNSYRLISQMLDAPDGYHPVQLNKNLRNCREIVRYAQQSLGVSSAAGLREPGSAKRIRCSWATLEEKLLAHCASLLKNHASAQIRILVDPYLVHPDCGYTHTTEESEHAWRTMMDQLSPIARGIVLAASGGSFLHSTFECETEIIEEVLITASETTVFFVATNGEEISVIDETKLNQKSIRSANI